MWDFITSLIKPSIGWLSKWHDDAPHKERLRELLTDMPEGVNWRSIKLLSQSIGADENETARLLIKIGARRSTGDQNVWALRSDRP